jgi:hypothetical protein
MTEQGTASGYYVGNMPACVAGSYNLVVKVRAGGSPAETDQTADLGSLEWDGTAVQALYHVPVILANAVAHGGSTATLALETLAVVAAANETAVTITGHGTGAGLSITADTGNAVDIVANPAANGVGISVVSGNTALHLYSSNGLGADIFGSLAGGTQAGVRIGSYYGPALSLDVVSGVCILTQVNDGYLSTNAPPVILTSRIEHNGEAQAGSANTLSVVFMPSTHVANNGARFMACSGGWDWSFYSGLVLSNGNEHMRNAPPAGP